MLFHYILIFFLICYSSLYSLGVGTNFCIIQDHGLREKNNKCDLRFDKKPKYDDEEWLLAVMNQNVSKVTFFVKNGSDFNGVNRNANTALFLAVKNGNLNTVKYLKIEKKLLLI